MNQRIWAVSLLAGVLSSVALPAFSANHTMTISGESGDVYTPAALTIQTGDSVTFVNGGGLHNVGADLGFQCAETCDGFPNPPSSAPWSSTITGFNDPNTYVLRCDAHADVTATITVVGTHHSPPPIGPGHTGSWFNPDQDGHGFFIQILPENRVVAAWYVYSPEGEQAWIVGTGSYLSSVATIEGFDATGGQFMPNFRPETVRRAPWGTMTFQFRDCNTGVMSYNSRWGWGATELTRLTRPAGLSCTPPPASTPFN